MVARTFTGHVDALYQLIASARVRRKKEKIQAKIAPRQLPAIAPQR
jgi:hypothetical protein